MGDNKKYVIYMHISPSRKRYIGITSQIPEKRWHKDGSGYKDNHIFGEQFKSMVGIISNIKFYFKEKHFKMRVKLKNV